MTGSWFRCMRNGEVSREDCGACFLSRPELQRVYLTRAICASSHARKVVRRREPLPRVALPRPEPVGACAGAESSLGDWST